LLKPLVLGATLLCAHTVDVEAHSRYRNRAWCGSYMAKYFGISDPRLAVARMWASVGVNAGGPAIGAIVVWSHHVGVITGRTAGGEWIVHSGNDGGAVRTRPRAVTRAIAFRRL
jgi:hypothetical protein